MIFTPLLVTLLLLTMVRSQLSLFDTELPVNTGRLEFDCLHYYHRSRSIATDSSDYCVRPVNDTNSSAVDYLNVDHQNFTFDELSNLHVTAQELLSWSASIDLAERYQYFIDQENKSFLSDERFFNCTKSWFGSRCQYNFDLGETISLADILTMTLEAKWQHGFAQTVTNMTCYIHLKCDRGGSSMCLDWREVCDGRVDCLDGGADEAQCFDLEINECNQNEYRCHNGLCIPKDAGADVDLARCVDQSDIAYEYDCADRSSIDYLFRCEEHSCRPNTGEFSCGDGQCVEDFGNCQNGRHLLLIESMTAQGNLSDDCWMVLVCLTKLIDRTNGTLCERILRSSNFTLYLQSCELLTQFPTIPVISGHVRFLYWQKVAYNLNIELALTPDFICYDQYLCDFLQPTFHHGNYTCRHGHEMGFDSIVKYQNWTSIIRSIKPYFHGCLTRHKKENSSPYQSLYCCKNSSKCISKHRIVDGISDCYLNDDEEEFELSCSINDSRRFKCPNENKCRSPLFSRYACSSLDKPTIDELAFHDICDRIVQVLPVMIGGQNYTDETECEHWQCNNIYTRCDVFWSCSDGEDEENCTRPICPPRSLACVSPENYTLICLSADRVENGIIDCLGAADERQYCRTTHFTATVTGGFRCLNDTTCVGSSDLCDGYFDCRFGDDEIFCGNHHRICDKTNIYNRTNVQDALCHSGVLNRRTRFSLKTTPIYPLSENIKINPIVEWPVAQNIVVKKNKLEPDDPTWTWRCNYGLYARFWLGNNRYHFRCFCPPSYYGDTCQYQNQRISLTLIIAAIDLRGVYVIVTTLIDDDNDRQEINSYDQAIYVPADICRETFNIYLMYSTRPKNSSKNYSIRVDAFDKISLTYIASWHFRIPFPFLPINRLAIMLTVPSQSSPISSHCTLICHNGDCMKYSNEEKFFCRCHTHWSGAHCDIPVHCSDCSSDSICVGSIHNRSICVCPLNKFGPRCMLAYSSCPINFCKNNGQCVVVNERRTSESYICICLEQFFGSNCEKVKSKLEISFNEMKVSSHLLAYVFSVHHSYQQPIETIMLQKLMPFQLTVTLYLPIYIDMVFVKIDNSYYLAVLQQSSHSNISTSIGPAQRCAPINVFFNSDLLTQARIRRVKYYHLLCKNHFDLICFFDEFYMCLCTFEHHANCFKFDPNPNLKCRDNVHCQNGGTCLENSPYCPSQTICICTDCFFGDRCQFYAKGIGLTLDDILRYEIRPNTTLNHQPLSVKVSAILIMFMFVVGWINGILTFLTFYQKDARKIGCSLYLLASSISTLLTMSIFTIKFWFLVLTHIHLFTTRFVLRGGCVGLELALKVCLYMDNWLSACVATERAIIIFKGVNFNKMTSKSIARWIIFFLPFFITITLIHDFLYRDLFDDNEEQRVWCVTHYSQSIHSYNIAILFFHLVAPFSINLLSALFIIFTAARQRVVTRTRLNYEQHLREQFDEHKQLVISPIILVILSLPGLIISMLSGCVKAAHNPWLYLSGYFTSFIPSTIIFIVFVLPSTLYKKQFKKSLKCCR